MTLEDFVRFLENEYKETSDYGPKNTINKTLIEQEGFLGTLPADYPRDYWMYELVKIGPKDRPYTILDFAMINSKSRTTSFYVIVNGQSRGEKYTRKEITKRLKRAFDYVLREYGIRPMLLGAICDGKDIISELRLYGWDKRSWKLSPSHNLLPAKDDGTTKKHERSIIAELVRMAESTSPNADAGINAPHYNNPPAQ